MFLAGGNGVTALLPMIEAGLTEGRQVKLLYSNRSTDSRSFGKLFQSYKLQYGDRFQVVEFYLVEEPLILLINFIDVH